MTKTLIKIDRSSIRRNHEFDQWSSGVRQFVRGQHEGEMIETTTMSPPPEWFYKFIPAKVTCRDCGAEFMDTELKSDWAVDGDGDDYEINRICPKCGESDCCELEFERIEDVVKA